MQSLGGVIRLLHNSTRRSLTQSVIMKRKAAARKSANKAANKSSSKRARNDDGEIPEQDQDQVKAAKVDVNSDHGDSLKENNGDSGSNSADEKLAFKETTVDGRRFNFKISSWNVAGVRAVAKKSGCDWIMKDNADIVCLQETKCEKESLPAQVKALKRQYPHQYWNAATSKKGYSGVSLLSKSKPLSVKYGLGVKEHDQEGRTITAEYPDFYLVTTYVPNSARGLVRLEYRMRWNKDFDAHLKKLDKEKPVVLCGDMNVAHLEIDLKNPKSNVRNAGFTKEERDGMTSLLDAGFVDTFRRLYPDQVGAYTFWTYMGNARAKNVGWRLDYFILSDRWVGNVCDNVMQNKVMGSDHCPISLFLALPSG